MTGFIADATSAANPHGLPVGLTTVHSRDKSHTGLEMVGFNCAARFAGRIPNTRPTVQLTPNATTMASGEIGIRMSANNCTLNGIATPTRIPISPPYRLTIIASVRN